MTKVEGFTATEFADFWASHSEEKELGIAWMAQNVVTSEGKALLSEVATILAQRYGVSSPEVKTFRTALRKACQKAGSDDILTVKKQKGTPVSMVTSVVVPHTSPKVGDGEELAYNRMKKWVDKGECTAEEVYNAANTLYGIEVPGIGVPF